MRYFFLLFICSTQYLLGFAQAQRHNTYAIIVGISKYDQKNNIPALKYADRDAQEFADYLRSRSGGSVPAENIQLLLNENATVAAVYQAMTWLKRTCEKDDLVFFYFAGHGDKETETIYNLGFLLTYNTPRPNYINNALRIEDLNNCANTLSISNKANVVLITDACHSGDLAGKGFRGSLLVGDALRITKSKEIRITSCASNQLAAEGKDWGEGRGVFSYYLVNGLKGVADRDKDGVVSINDIQLFMDSCFANDPIIAENRIKQNPVVKVAKGNENFKLADVDSNAAIAARMNMGRPLVKKAMMSFVPMRPQEYFFDLLARSKNYQFSTYFDQEKGRSIGKYGLARTNAEALADYSALSELPAEEIPIAFCEMAIDSIKIIKEMAGDSTFVIDLDKVNQFIATLRADKNALSRFSDKLVVLLHNRGQEIINLYLNADEAEMERHRYYNSGGNGYDVYPKMFEVALKLISPDNDLYPILQADKHYFAGVAARLKVPTLKDPKKALDAAMREQLIAVKMQPDAAYIHTELGFLYMHKRDLKNAEAQFFKATQLAQDWAIPWVGLAELYRIAKANKESLEAGEKAKALQPYLQEIYINDGIVYQQKGNLLMAEELYRKSIKINSRHYLPYEGLGKLYLNTTQYALADSFYYEAEERKRGYAFEELMNHRNIKLPKTDTDSGTNHICPIDSMDIAKEDIMGHFVEGIIAEYNGNTQLAEKYFKDVIALDRTNPLAFHYLGRLLYRQQRWQEAELILKFAAEFYLDKASFKKYTDSLYISQPFTKSIGCSFSRFTNYYYDRINDNYILGTVYQLWGHFSEAEEQFRTIIGMDPEAFGGHYKLWNLLENTGRYDDAEDAIRNYVSINEPFGLRELNDFYTRMIGQFPDIPEWYYKAGSFLYRLAAIDSHYYTYDLKEIEPDTYEERYIQRLEISNIYINRLKPKMIHIPGTEELVDFPEEISRPMTNGIVDLKTADSLLLQAGDDLSTASINEKIGDLCVWQGLPEKAIPYYTKTLDTDTGNAGIRSKLAGIYTAVYQFQAAAEQFDSLYSRHEINFSDQLKMADFYIRSGRFSAADTLLKAIQKIHPYKVGKIIDLEGRLNLMSNHPKEALPFYKDLLTDDPLDSMTMYTIARLYAMSGNTVEALKWLAMSINKGFNYSFVLALDPYWEKYRGSKKWNDLTASIKRKEY